MSGNSAKAVFGVDGTKSGWIFVKWRGPQSPVAIYERASLEAMTSEFEQVSEIGIDIPLGLLTLPRAGGRMCDQVVRKEIGIRRSSVFSAPCSAILDKPTFRVACDSSRGLSDERVGISQQTFALFSKIREARKFATSRRTPIVEVHPEFSFFLMNEGELEHKKSSSAGKFERLGLLASAGFLEIERTFEAVPAKTRIDFLDACAAAWSAWRKGADGARRGFDSSQSDLLGIKIEIWG